MADVVDKADKYTALGISGQLEEIRKELAANVPPAAARYCEDCGGDIPEARRRVVPGCTRCIECQKLFEES